MSELPYDVERLLKDLKYDIELPGTYFERLGEAEKRELNHKKTIWIPGREGLVPRKVSRVDIERQKIILSGVAGLVSLSSAICKPKNDRTVANLILESQKATIHHLLDAQQQIPYEI